MSSPTETLVCTICCREKDPSPRPLPAIRRYRSTRILNVYRLARKAHAGFAILSGEFGLLPPDQPIPYYDKLLHKKDVPRIEKKITAFLKANPLALVHFLVPDPAVDPKVIPYIESMRRAARKARVGLDIRFVPPYPPAEKLRATG